MPRTDVVFFKESDGSAPVVEWPEDLRTTDDNAYGRCAAAIGRLAALGHEARRPLADILQDGVYELRIRAGRVNIRILYFFYGRGLASLAYTVRKTKDAIQILDRITGGDKALRERIEHARINFEVAQMIYDARTKAGLSQRQLAELIGSRQPVIARLEDAGYEGHSLTMLQRIAEALHQRLELRFVPSHRRAVPARAASQPSRPVVSVGKNSRSRV